MNLKSGTLYHFTDSFKAISCLCVGCNKGYIPLINELSKKVNSLLFSKEVLGKNLSIYLKIVS